MDRAGEPDQEVAEGCKRLITDAIGCWNDLDLTRKIADVTFERASGVDTNIHGRRGHRV